MDKHASKVTTATYNAIAEAYAERYFEDIASDMPFINKFLSFVPRNGLLLDVGCGPGTFTQCLNKNGLKVIAIDVSDNMLAIAREKMPDVDFRHMDMRALTFAENTFDGVLAAYSLIHVPSKEIQKTLNGFYKILKQRGVLLLITQKGQPDRLVTEPLSPEKSLFINFFDPKKLRRDLMQAKFTILNQQEMMCDDPESLTDTIIYTLAQK